MIKLQVPPPQTTIEGGPKREYGRGIALQQHALSQAVHEYRRHHGAVLRTTGLLLDHRRKHQCLIGRLQRKPGTAGGPLLLQHAFHGLPRLPIQLDRTAARRKVVGIGEKQPLAAWMGNADPRQQHGLLEPPRIRMDIGMRIDDVAHLSERDALPQPDGCGLPLTAGHHVERRLERLPWRDLVQRGPIPRHIAAQSNDPDEALTRNLKSRAVECCGNSPRTRAKTDDQTTRRRITMKGGGLIVAERA